MDSWVIYALVTAFCWGTYSVVAHIVTSHKYFNLDPQTASLLMLIGISIVFVLYFLARFPNVSSIFKLASIVLISYLILYAILATREQGLHLSLPVMAAGVLQGLLWATGMVTLYMALSTGAPVGKIASIYNFNLLITIILGILLLKEIPLAAQQVKLVIGGSLIILGGILTVL